MSSILENERRLSAQDLDVLFEEPSVRDYPLLSSLAQNFKMALDDLRNPMVWQVNSPNGFSLVGRSFKPQYETIVLQTQTSASLYDTLGITGDRRRTSSLSLKHNSPRDALCVVQTQAAHPNRDDYLILPEGARGIQAVEDRLFIPATKRNMRWQSGAWMGYMEAVTGEFGHQILGFGPRELVSTEGDTEWVLDLEYYFNDLFSPDSMLNW